MKAIKYPLILLFGLLMLGVSAQKVKNETIKLDYLQFPTLAFEGDVSYSVSLTGPDLNVTPAALARKGQGNSTKVGFPTGFLSDRSFTHTTSGAAVNVQLVYGQFTQTDKKLKDHEIPCTVKGADLKKENIRKCPAFYYEVSYTMPCILLVSDAAGNVLFAEEVYGERESLTTTFGYDASTLSGYLKKAELDEAFASAKPTLQTNAVRTSVIKVQERVQELFFFLNVKEQVKIGSGDGDYNYSDQQGAQADVAAAFKSLKKNNDLETFRKAVTEALTVWEKEVGEEDLVDKKARISKKVAFALKMNLAQTYQFLHEYDKAYQWALAAKSMSHLFGNTEFRTSSTALANRMGERKRAARNGAPSGIPASLNEAPVIMAIARDKKAPQGIINQADEYAAAQAKLKAFEGDSQDAMLSDWKEQKDDEVAAAGDNKYTSRVMQSTTQGFTLVLSAWTDKLDAFPTEVCELTHLNMLNISSIPVKAVPADIGQLKALKSLILKNCSLSSLPVEIGQLESLEVLNLKDNQLTSLPTELGKLPNLKKLVISGNSIPQSEIDALANQLPSKCKIINK